MTENDFILDFILAQGGVTKEYYLLEHIEKNHAEFFQCLGETPSLYKKHFFLFNRLYQLNDKLLLDNRYLIISALEIRLVNSCDAGKAVGEVDGLKGFYLDLDNLHLSDEAIQTMQRQFWQKYLALENKSKAIKILQLDGVSPLNRAVLKKQFNQLAKKYHPDKGGDSERFVDIKQAYEELKLILK